MKGPTAVRPAGRPTTGPHVRRWVASAVAVAVAVVGISVPISRLLAPPSFVERIAFENPTEYDLAVEATDAARDGWLSVGTAHSGRTTTMEDIIDQGEVWIFRFTGQGEHGGELRISRAELEDHNWKVRIPVAIGDALRARGAEPPP